MKSVSSRARFGRRIGAAAIGLAACLPFTTPADAADAAAPKAEAPLRAAPDWTVTVSPYLWGASLNGDAAVFHHKRAVDVPFRDTVKDLKFGFMGAIEIQRGKLGFFANGQYTDVESNERLRWLDIGVGTRSTMLAAGASYRLFEAALGGDTVHGAPRIFALDPLAGVRWTRMTGSISVAGAGLSKTEAWFDPLIGARMTLDIDERWNLFAEADVGGFGVGSRITYNAQAYLGYRTTLLGRPTMLRAGYRALYQDYRDGGFLWKVTQHGPVLGASMQF
ncbi:MAG TPA: hypothetical protein VGO06_11120 [Bosea sp. (in: a-proteobacteria)]|jgi:hypothetical protein|uniref:hypothetical protein n=1 Tax=Bosea sp. (in: a-proteobacteria) TaxID=1871050 RepID=UPI002E163A24|nr:hypothetical protein [Bosea sp. (in: a-proteobacteria)]